jgi:cation transport regulator ChaB
MAVPHSVELSRLIQSLQRLRANTSIPFDFHGQMELVNNLLRNDKTGIVNSILGFQVNAANVPLKIETKDAKLDEVFNIWQSNILNKDLAIDVPRGLRELSSEYYKERWSSSFIALRIKWETVKINKISYSLPTKMWFVDGASLYVEPSLGKLNGRKYRIGKQGKELTIKDNQSIIIRKPFASWYQNYPVPYLVQKGVLFNALLKDAILTKQSDVIEAVIPYLLLLKSGSDKLAELDLLAGDEEDLKKLKEALLKAKEEHDMTGSLGSLIATISHDVNFEHFIPDFSKVFNSDITKANDRNILAGMGMIEMQGFSKDREESILNPKILVEEVKDAVIDWSLIVEEVIYQFIERNRERGVDSLKTNVRVVPGQIKTFITEGLKGLINVLYSRGQISKQSTVETVGDFDYEVERERRRKETENGDDETMKAPITQRQETQPTKTQDPNRGDDNQNPPGEDTREETATLDLQSSYDTVDELPDTVKVLPVAAQIIFLKTFNSSIEHGHTTEDAFNTSWAIINKSYKVNKTGKWIKKTTSEFQSSLRESDFEELVKIKKLNVLNKQEKLLNKLLKDKENENL